jgi:rod shape-determining protein MreC
LGRTRNQIEKLKAENANLKQQLINRKNADAQLKQLKSILDLAGTAGYKVVNAKVISNGSSQSFSQTITIDSGTNAGIKKNMTVLSQYGIAGVVKDVYPNTALIQLASDPNRRTYFRNPANRNSERSRNSLCKPAIVG